MGSFGIINEFLALAKCLKHWGSLFSSNKVDEGGKTKVGGFETKSGGNFSWEINHCFLMCSNQAHYCHWNSRSWTKNWTLGLTFEG